jgi:methyltransferase (TIGR00027 family)
MKDRPSSTAMLVLNGVAFRATDPRYAHLVSRAASDHAAALLRAAGQRPRHGGNLLDRAIVHVMERFSVPGLSLHYILRKRYIEEVLRRAFASDFRQLVVIGAGLDTVALRLVAEFPALNAIEVDHPATQSLKRELLQSAGIAAPITFLPVDLTRTSLSTSLATCAAFDRTAPTLFLAEAVFLYLTEDEVREALRSVRTAAARSRIVFTFFAPRTRGTINFQNATPIADWWLRWRGEPIRWAIDPGAMQHFLASEGFDLQEVALDDTFQRRYVSARVPLARGEHIAVANA